MTNAAVADPTVTDTNAAEASAKAAEASASTDATKGTAADGTTVQPGEGEGGEGEGEGAKTPYDGVVAAQRKADAMEMAEEFGLEGDYATVADVRAARADQVRAEREESRAETSKTYYADLSRTLNEALADLEIEITDELGAKSKGKLTKEQIQASVFNHLSDFTTKVRDVEQKANYEDLADAAVTLLGTEEAVDKWAAEVQGKGLSFNEWLASVVEHAAPTSKAWKKLEREHKVEKEKEFARGWDEGNKAPPGQASQNNAGNGSSGGGKLTREKYLNASKEERVQMWKDRPAEVRSLS